MRRLVFCGLTFALFASAADLAGTWQNETPGRGGQPNITTCVLKVEGTKITGTYATAQRAFPIEKGTMDGSQFTFQTSDAFQTPPRITEYKGSLVGDQFELTTVMPAGAPAGGRGFGRGPQGPRPFKKISADVVFHAPPELTPTHKPFPAFQPISSNGLSKTPPMGWNSWNKFAGRVDDKSVREMADAIVSSGMRDAGYIYVNIDDTWEGKRDADGNITSNEKFPDMKALADYIHAKGLKIGIYSSPGPQDLRRLRRQLRPRGAGRQDLGRLGLRLSEVRLVQRHARLYRPDEMQAAYQKMGDALRATGRPIVYSLCQYGDQCREWGAGGRRQSLAHHRRHPRRLGSMSHDRLRSQVGSRDLRRARATGTIPTCSRSATAA